MYKVIFVFLLFLFAAPLSFSQDEEVFKDFRFCPKFRSVQLDASTVLVVSKIGIAIDFDLTGNHWSKSIRHSFGLRAGADRILKYKWEGTYHGSPFHHINLYSRFSTESDAIRIDTYIGGAYQITSGESTISNNSIILKGGIDCKIKFSSYVGFIANGTLSTGESFFGIGLYISSK